MKCHQTFGTLFQRKVQVLRLYQKTAFASYFGNSNRQLCRIKQMIKWCLYLRHLSGNAYKGLRLSGCLQLPSQRTLRDYSKCVKAGPGFSKEVDEQFLSAARLSSPQWQALVGLILDEMHVRRTWFMTNTLAHWLVLWISVTLTISFSI